MFNGNHLTEINSGSGKTLVMERELNSGNCLAVFDGIGGENFGEQASCAAAAKMADYLKGSKPFYLSDSKYLEKMADGLNRAVLDKAEELVTSRMGTTFAGIYITPSHVNAVNLGDSKIYLLRDGILRQMSVDDVSSRTMASGKKAPITQYLGMDPMDVRLIPHISRSETRRGDCYLLCTDGLSDMVSNDEIADILRQRSNIEETVNLLIGKALVNGGRDNVTVIVCDIR